MRGSWAILFACLVWASSAAAQTPATRPGTTAAVQPATAPAADAERRRQADADALGNLLRSLPNDFNSVAAELTALSTKLQASGITIEVEAAFWPRKAEIDARLKENENIVGGVPTLETLGQQRQVLDADYKQLYEWGEELNRRNDELRDGQQKLQGRLAEWRRRKDDLVRLRTGRPAPSATQTTQATQGATRPADPAGRFAQRVDATLAQLEQLAGLYDWELRLATNLGTYISDGKSSVSDGLAAVNTKQREARDRLLVVDSPPLWDALLHPMALASDVTEQGRNSFTNQWRGLTAYLARQTREMLMHAVGVGVLAAVLIWLRRRTRQWVGSDPHLLEATRVFQTPVATAFTASMILTPWIYVAAPRLFWGVLGTAALLPTLIVLRPLTERSLRPLLYGLAVAIFVNLLLGVVAALPQVYRALQLGQMGGAAVFFLWFLRTGRGVAGDPSRPPLRRAAVVGARIGLGITVVASLANVFGYVSLARLIGNALLTSAYLGVLLDTSVNVADAVLLGLSHVKPTSALGMVQRHRPLLLKRLHLLLMVLAIGLWGYFTLEALSVRQPVYNAARAVWYWPHSPDEFVRAVPPTPDAEPPVKIPEDPAEPTVALTTPTGILVGRETLLTVGGVVSFVLSVAAAIYAARFIAFLLDEDVYPRLNLARGMPYAITTLLRYVVWAVGFCLAIYNLGFQDFTKLTILASAFSIGLGFGLQNIVQNFVGGLILLFERPVQVGDVIEIEGVSGVVSRIGIRASVIRTPLAAEIILPNGTLISGRVINWTLSNRQRGVELAITVAAGVEPQRVIQLMISSARQLPLVAAYPSPQAYFVDFSGGGLRFEVRAWTNRFEDWAQVRSELAVAINAMLMKENVELK